MGRVSDQGGPVGEPSLEDAIEKHERRAAFDGFVGDVVPDRNIGGRVLIVTSSDRYYSICHDDIVDMQSTGEGMQRVWVRRGAIVWQSTRVIHEGERVSLPFTIEMREVPPAVPFVDGMPAEGTPSDQAHLQSGRSIEGAAKTFAHQCEGGDTYPNNCAHYLSNAFIQSGFNDLRDAHSCVGARCETMAKRPIRARDMWCWFKSRATSTSSRVAKNTGIWTVFQLSEAAYWGGHVAIIDSNTWKYYGTGWYDSWDQYSYKW
jgi:hypothetical protein